MAVAPTAKWNYPTNVRFGAGRIAELPQACVELGIRQPLLVTDPSLAKLAIVRNCIEACGLAGLHCDLYSDVQANPVEENATRGVQRYRAGGHDGVIAFGGGSALDVGKAIALMVGQSRSIWDFEDREDWYTRVNVAGIAPVIAVPTTAGTGSEVGRAAVITDVADHTKKIIFHPRMLPALVIADPALTVGLPADVTAATGMDALSHSLEAFCASGYHPMADGIALEAMRLVGQWLPRAYRDGTDLEARSHMLAASSMGATAFQKGLGAMHSMSHPCSAHLGTHHGLTNAVVMPYVLAFNKPAIAERLARFAAYAGLKQARFNAVLDWVLELRATLNIPHTLAALGMRDEHIEVLARDAHLDPSTPGNPRPVLEENFAQLYRNAIHGVL
jgi:alcohol dehydrogenase class IV